jgi:hypothetical protein
MPQILLPLRMFIDGRTSAAAFATAADDVQGWQPSVLQTAWSVCDQPLTAANCASSSGLHRQQHQ